MSEGSENEPIVFIPSGEAFCDSFHTHLCLSMFSKINRK